ncbi:MAG: hypothetical protein ACXW08_12200 [Solirubrobacteraceae bacterium]
MVVAAVARTVGASPRERETASFAVDLRRGGNAGQIVIVSRNDAASEATHKVGEDLQRMAFLRAIVLPLVAVAFDLLACAATFGGLWLLFSGDDPPLGGPGYLDPMSVIGIFATVLGLTMVYEVVVLQRTREDLRVMDDPVQAIRAGLRQRAAPATCAAAVMVAAFLPFATTDLMTVRQFGVGPPSPCSSTR